MKLRWLALFSVATAAFCQTPAPGKIDPDKLFQLPEKFTHAGPDFNAFKSLPPMKHDFVLLRPTIDVPHFKPNDPQIDPGIIARPPRSRSQGLDYLPNLYPHLKLLPIR